MDIPRTSYFVCTNQRSGSWLLCEGLASTSLAGNPREWFGDEEARELCAKWGIDYSADSAFPAYLTGVYQHGTTDNGICGAKVMYYQFAEFSKKLATLTKYRRLPLADSLSILFPQLRWIWLRRRDTARQAISFYRACQTDVWWKIDGAQKPRRSGTTDDATFDPLAIARLEQEIVLNDMNWQAYFNDSGIAPLTVYYEDLASDYAGTLAHVLKWIGVPDADSVPIAAPRLKKQADSQTEEWLSRYMACEPAVQPTLASPTTSTPETHAASGIASAQAAPAAVDRIPPPAPDTADRLAVSISRDELLFEFLSAGRDVGCPGCGCNLRELTTNRCPECGDELVLQIGLVEPRQAACITGLVGLSAGTGFSGLLLLYLVFTFMREGLHMSDSDILKFMLICGGGFVVEGICLLIWIAVWKSIRRMRSRWLLASLTWVLSLVNLVVFSVNIR